MRKFTSSSVRFFDNLVSYLGAVSSLALGTAAQHSGNVRAFSPTENIVLHGRAKVTNIEFVFYPYQMLQSIVTGGWPTSIEIEERPLSAKIPTRFRKVSGVKRFQMVQIQLAFIEYFETVRPQIENRCTQDNGKWPAIWNFGRVVRNAFAHGGQVNFVNPNALPVTLI
jgi:hypothetical protein